MFVSVTPNLVCRDIAARLAFYRVYGMREFAVTDPDGHLLTFAQRVSAA